MHISQLIGNVTELSFNEDSNNVEPSGKVSDVILSFAMEVMKWFLRSCCNYVDPRDF